MSTKTHIAEMEALEPELAKAIRDWKRDRLHTMTTRELIARLIDWIERKASA